MLIMADRMNGVHLSLSLCHPTGTLVNKWWSAATSSCLTLKGGTKHSQHIARYVYLYVKKVIRTVMQKFCSPAHFAFSILSPYYVFPDLYQLYKHNYRLYVIYFT